MSDADYPNNYSSTVNWTAAQTAGSYPPLFPPYAATIPYISTTTSTSTSSGSNIYDIRIQNLETRMQVMATMLDEFKVKVIDMTEAFSKVSDKTDDLVAALEGFKSREAKLSQENKYLAEQLQAYEDELDRVQDEYSKTMRAIRDAEKK